MAGRANPEPHPGDAASVAWLADQPGDVDSLADPHVWDRSDSAADSPVDQVAAAGEQSQIPGEPNVPTVRIHPSDIPGRVYRLRAGLHQLFGQAREEPLKNFATTSEQAVHVPALWQSLASGWSLGELVGARST